MPTEMNIINFDCSSLQHVQIGYDMHQGNALDLMLNEQNAKQCTHYLPYAYIEGSLKIGSQELKGLSLASPAEGKVVTGIPLLQFHINPLTNPVRMFVLPYTTPNDTSAIQKAKLDGNLQTEREVQAGEIKIFNIDPTVAPGKPLWISYLTIPAFKTNIAMSITDGRIDINPQTISEDPANKVKAWNMSFEPPEEEVTVDQDFGDNTKNAWKWRSPIAAAAG